MTASTRRRLLRVPAGVLSLVAAASAGGLAGCDGAPGALGGRAAQAPAVSGTIVATYPIARMEEITFKKLFRLAEERHPGLKIDEIGISGNPPEVVTTMFAGGTPPDAIRMSGAREYTFFAVKGFTVPLDDFLRRGDYPTRDLVPFAIEGGKWRGKQVALVFHLGGNAIYFNKTLLGTRGVRLPTEYERQGRWNWGTLLELLRAVSTGPGPTRSWGINRIETLDNANAWIYSAGASCTTRTSPSRSSPTPGRWRRCSTWSIWWRSTTWPPAWPTRRTSRTSSWPASRGRSPPPASMRR